MIAAEPALHVIPELDWEDLGESNWSATAPDGRELSYRGPRFSLLERNYTRITAEISLPRAGQAKARLSRESAFDRQAKRLGYAIEHQTGDARFDEAIYLASDDPALAQALAASPAARQAVLDLLVEGVEWVSIGSLGWTVRLTEGTRPDKDGGAALSVVALRLCALAALWPNSAALPAQPMGRQVPYVLGAAWAVGVAALVLGRWMWGADEGWTRQIETFADTDWLGMGLLMLVALTPFAVMGARRARSHRTLVWLTVIMLAVLPLSKRLLQVDINRLYDRSRALAPVAVSELRIDPDRQWSKGYLLGGVVEDLPVEWKLSPEQGRVAVEGKLCVSAVVAEGLRSLHYVRELRTWICQPGEASAIPPPTPAAAEAP